MSMNNDHGMCHTFVLVLLGQNAETESRIRQSQRETCIYSFEQRDKCHFMQTREGLPMPMHMAKAHRRSTYWFSYDFPMILVQPVICHQMLTPWS
jgi:hypothetical protein